MKYGSVGPASRASGIPDDVRVIDQYAAYDDIPFDAITDDHCDVFGRAVVRVLEIMESIKIIRYALDNMPDSEFGS